VTVSPAWASVIATLLAVVVALFKEDIIRLWHHPVLVASYPLDHWGCIKFPEGFISATEIKQHATTYYFRFVVENKGNVRAESVEVLAASLEWKRAGAFTKKLGFVPRNLCWTESEKGPEQTVLPGLSPATGRLCDLGSIVDPKRTRQMLGPSGSPEAGLTLSLKSTRGHLLIPGDYRLTLDLTAANSRPSTYIIEFTFSGEWYDDEVAMREKGLKVTRFESQKAPWRTSQYNYSHISIT
jgi:hypothetical protein